MSIYDAGRVFVAVCIVLPIIGATIIQYVVFGRIGIAPLADFLFSYNYIVAREERVSG